MNNWYKTLKRSKYNPPSWVFGIVWPILLLLLGYSWTLRPKLKNYYLILTLLLSTWSIFYANNRIYAFFNILLTIGLTIYLIFYKFKKKSSYLLVPLVVWLSYASYLSYNSI